MRTRIAQWLVTLAHRIGGGSALYAPEGCVVRGILEIAPQAPIALHNISVIPI